MKKLLLFLLLVPFHAEGQSCNVLPITGRFTYDFSTIDTAYHALDSRPIRMIPDTATAPLWQIGNTLKDTFSNRTIPARGVMTDTMHYYPPNANNFFTIDIGSITNPTITFWHRYETDSLHAGGVVEFSTDKGLTWKNIINCTDMTTSNFYSMSDSLFSGQPAFTGHTNGTQISCISILDCIAIKTTSTDCIHPFFFPDDILLRFRFISDTTIDSLSGWIIDSIRIESTMCEGSVHEISAKESITISPNPALEVLNVNATSEIKSVTIYNAVGQKLRSIITDNTEIHLDVAQLPKGLYFIKVNEIEVKPFLKE